MYRTVGCRCWQFLQNIVTWLDRSLEKYNENYGVSSQSIRSKFSRMSQGKYMNFYRECKDNHYIDSIKTKYKQNIGIILQNILAC